MSSKGALLCDILCFWASNEAWCATVVSAACAIVSGHDTLRTVHGYTLQMVLSPLLGESGLGKSTLIKSLFLTNFFGNKSSPPAIGECAAQREGREGGEDTHEGQQSTIWANVIWPCLSSNGLCCATIKLIRILYRELACVA